MCIVRTPPFIFLIGWFYCIIFLLGMQLEEEWLQKGTANHSRCPSPFKQLRLHASLYLHVPQIFLDSTSEHRSPDNLYSGKPADQSADQK